jgi:hypothetical protein
MCGLSFCNGRAFEWLRVWEVVGVVEFRWRRRREELAVESIALSLAGVGNTTGRLQLRDPS